MTHDLKIGFARLSDCAPLVVAKERGEFDRVGLSVSFQRFGSWAAMRDALGAATIDAAHMLSPMVVASAAGLTPTADIFTTALVLNLNGNAITVSKAVFEEISRTSPELLDIRPLSAAVLKPLIAARQARGEPPLTFAHVYLHSMHAYELRYWLFAGGIDPDKDVELVVIPPERIMNSLTVGEIDGFCVGEPWNNAAVSAGVGRTLINSVEIWPNSPEKVLAVRDRWAQENADKHEAMIEAVLAGCIWLDRADNRITASQLISQHDYVDMPLDIVVSSLTGQNRQTGGKLRHNSPDFNVFHRYAANFPWLSQAKWILAQMIRWGDAADNVDVAASAALAFRPDIFRRVAKKLSISYPLVDEKTEGANIAPWVLEEASKPIVFRSDRFIDQRIFDPNDVDSYLANFGRKRRTSLDKSIEKSSRSEPA